MISVYINYPKGKISTHFDPDCTYIQRKNKLGQRIVQIDSESVGSGLEKLGRGDLKFASVARLNDVWIHINLGELSLEENLVKKIQEMLGRYYKCLARAEITTHCLNPADPRINSHNRTSSPPIISHHSVLGRKEMILNREKKIEAIVSTITSKINEFNSLYRSGPSLYFYRRIIELRKKHTNITSFLSDNYCLEILYATLVSWDMDSRGAKLKYFDEFKSALILCIPKLEATENELRSFNPAIDDKMLDLLKNAFQDMELMKTSGRLVSNSKCLHFLFPSLCMPMDGTNTLQYLFNSTYESVNRYLNIIKFSFEVMQQPVEFRDYLDDRWNQTVPKLIDNAIILLHGKSVNKRNKN